MSLHNGIDTVAIISNGVWTKTYGSAEQQNVCNLYASHGLLEDSPDIELIIAILKGLMRLGLSLTMR